MPKNELMIVVSARLDGEAFLADAQKVAENIKKLEGMVSRKHKKEARGIVRSIGKRLRSWFDLAVEQEKPKKKPAKRKK